jgi:signal transduction histidine kinase
MELLTSREETLEARLRRRERELDAVYRITQALHTGSTSDEVERQALLVAIEVLEASGGTMYVHDPKSAALVFKHVVNSDPEIVKKLQGMRMPDTQGVAGAVFQDGVRKGILDAQTDSAHNSQIDQQTGFITRDVLTVPLKSINGTTLGVMQVLNKRAGHFDDTDWEILEILGSQAASAMETSRLHEEARRAQVLNLVGDISHDVKNLLTPVVTGTQTLEMMIDAMFEDLEPLPGTLNEEQRRLFERGISGVREFYREAMNMVYDGARDAQERVREIADAIKGIVSEPHFEETDFRERVEAVARVLRMVAEPKGVFIDLTGIQETGPVELDRKGMYNALYNLINNAIPETPCGGSIFVRTRLLEDYNGVPGLEIQVQDTGRGMPAHVRETMFTDSAISTKPGGTGLGTRIVRNVVEAHHGKIWVESEEGKGTTFTFQIPTRQPKD